MALTMLSGKSSFGESMEVRVEERPAASLSLISADPSGEVYEQCVTLMIFSPVDSATERTRPTNLSILSLLFLYAGSKFIFPCLKYTVSVSVRVWALETTVGDKVSNIVSNRVLTMWLHTFIPETDVYKYKHRGGVKIKYFFINLQKPHAVF